MDDRSAPEGGRKRRRSAADEPPKPEFGTRVGNAAEVIANVDGRSLVARRYREIAANFVSDIGGDPSEAQRIIIRRAATIAIWCEHAEGEMANGREFDIGAFTTATNALRRLLADLGIERRAREVTDLRSYIDQARDAE